MELSEICDELERIASDKSNQYRDVAREMLDAYNNGMADRINGAGEFEADDDDYAAAVWESTHGAYKGITAAAASRREGRSG